MRNQAYQTEDTICALATAAGTGAIAVLRVSGKKTFPILAKVFKPYSGVEFLSIETQKVILGQLMDGNTPVDEVLVTKFVNPHSYTGEDVIEISCHGSWFYTAGDLAGADK
jgi:tRNA modification GTPase